MITHGESDGGQRYLHQKFLVTRLFANDFLHEITIVDRRIYKESATKHCGKCFLTNQRQATLIKFGFKSYLFIGYDDQAKANQYTICTQQHDLPVVFVALLY